jgi:hypothetical protein
MLRRSLPCLLILLLSSADLDDAWAIATPDPADDAQAAENNEYLYTPPCLSDRLSGTDQSPAAGPAVPSAGRNSPPGALHFLATPPAGPAKGGSLLYVFMSLQR